MASRTGVLWLEAPGGTRLSIKPGGLLIGRAPHCDLVLSDAGASRAQAIVYAGPGGPCLTVLGRGATLVNGEAVARDRELAVGDRIELPGAQLTIASDAAPAAPPASTWVVRGPGGLFGVVRTPFLVGGSDDADLRVAGPDQVLRFHVADRLHVEALAAIEVDGFVRAPGELEVLLPGAVITAGGLRFEVVAGGVFGQDSTIGETGNPSRGPNQVRLEFLARGGRLTVSWAGRDRAVYLPERRCDLIATLLQPPAPYAAGEHIPDEVVFPRIWPGRTMSRVDLNVLLHRARTDLVRAELDGAALLQRADGGNATRFLLGGNARVIVE